ncbi:hypothetical protein [Streptomyces sp. BF23-19]|uniref:hypothetical protein n=1 Tax=unclassified Streptomyces TaxID=2593676 RepID=UPI0034E419AA
MTNTLAIRVILECDRCSAPIRKQPDVYRWLTGRQDTPGPLATWVGAHVPELVEFAATDDRHNCARTER